MSSKSSIKCSTVTYKLVRKALTAIFNKDVELNTALAPFENQTNIQLQQHQAMKATEMMVSSLPFFPQSARRELRKP